MSYAWGMCWCLNDQEDGWDVAGVFLNPLISRGGLSMTWLSIHSYEIWYIGSWTWALLHHCSAPVLRDIEAYHGALLFWPVLHLIVNCPLASLMEIVRWYSYQVLRIAYAHVGVDLALEKKFGDGRPKFASPTSSRSTWSNHTWLSGWVLLDQSRVNPIETTDILELWCPNRGKSLTQV